MTPLQRERLDAAVTALHAAGATKLPDDLLAAFKADDQQSIAACLSRGRSYASIVLGSYSPDERERHRVACDAVGLLWAVVEDDPHR
jgi:hypothetical protein